MLWRFLSRVIGGYAAQGSEKDVSFSSYRIGRWAGKSGVAVLLIVALLVPALTGCQVAAPKADAQGLDSTAQVTRGDIAITVQLVGQVKAEQEQQLAFGTVGGRVQEIFVQPGQEVVEGQVLMQLGTAALERKLREAQADQKVAETALAVAQQTSGPAEMAQAEAALARAEHALLEAKQALDAAEAAGLAPLEATVEDAQAALQAALDDLRIKEIRLNQATLRQFEYQQSFFQRKIRDTQAGTAEHEDAKNALVEVERQLSQAQSSRAKALKAAQEAVDAKAAELEQAKERLERVKSGQEDPLAALRLDYEQALAMEEQARKRLEDLQQGLDSEAVQAARTALEAAIARVEDVEAEIEDTTLRAPFDGVVFGVTAQVDRIIQPSDRVIYLVDAKSLHLVAQTSEADIAKLEVGQIGRASFDASPNTFYQAEIIELPIRGQEGGGMSSYRVVAALLDPDSHVRPGLTANLRIIVGERQDVLMIPTAAVQSRTPFERYVTVLDAQGAKRQQSVDIGMNDGIMVEVLSGLQEGDTVVLPMVAPMDSRDRPGQVIMVQ